MLKRMDQDRFLETGRRVVRREADALGLLSDALDLSFSQAVATMLNAKGRVIISGMGKSGHIARKIAATFASTGTPAHFVHPAEASHGDLGMMAQGDVALVLSNSGETPELADVIAYTRRFAIPLIGIASQPDSNLLRQCDVQLVLPPAREACEQGIVPTSSTSMALALGDALAIAMMEHREFTPEHFRQFHPGGKLGAKLSKVRDLMHRDLPLVSPDTRMSDALLVMTQKSYGVLGIHEAGRLKGIITDGDLRRNMDGLLDLRAEDVMTPDPTTIGPDQLAETALRIMSGRITCLFVVDPEGSQDVIGILHVHDCLRAGIA